MMSAFTRLLPARISENAAFNLSSRVLLPIRRNLSGEVGKQKPADEKAWNDELVIDDEEYRDREAEVLKKVRDISRLSQADKNRVHGIMPYEEPIHPAHFTIRYHRRLVGRYGGISGVNPGLCWPTKEELEDRKEYERVAYPYTIQQVVEQEKIKAEAAERARRELDEKVAQNVMKLTEWKKALADKIQMKENEIRAAQERKKRLIAEVREHFNYALHEHDDRFKEEVALRIKNIKEQVKLERKAKKLEKKEKLQARRAAVLERKIGEEEMVENDK